MFYTPPRDHRPPRPRRSQAVPIHDAIDDASGIFSMSGTVSECTMASFLLESNDRKFMNGANRNECPGHQFSPNTAALLQRKQEDARVAILSLNRFIFQAGNLYRGERLCLDEENILRESAQRVGLSRDIVDALLEHTSDSNAVVKYCMNSDDSFARKLRQDRRLSELLQQGASDQFEGTFNLRSSIWRILMHKIVQQVLRDHGMDIGDVMNKSSLTSQLHAEATHNDQYAMNLTERERYGRNYTAERKRLSLPEDEIQYARRNAVAQIDFRQSRPFGDLDNNDIPLMMGGGVAIDCRDDEMSLLNARGAQREEELHSSQIPPRSSPLTPRSMNMQQRNTLHRAHSSGNNHLMMVHPPTERNGLQGDCIEDKENEGRILVRDMPENDDYGLSPRAPLSAVRRALAVFESPGKFDQDQSQKIVKSVSKVRRGSSSKIADRLALFERGISEMVDPPEQHEIEIAKSSNHQTIQATSLFDVFSTPQKQRATEQRPQRAASTSKIPRTQIAAFENRGFENKVDTNERRVRSEVKKLDPSRRRLFDDTSKSSPSIQNETVSGSVDQRRAFGSLENISHQRAAEFFQSGYEQVTHPQHALDSIEGGVDSLSEASDTADKIVNLKHRWKNHSTPPNSIRWASSSGSIAVPLNATGYKDNEPESRDLLRSGKSPVSATGDPHRKRVTFKESSRADPIRKQGSFSNPQKSAIDKMLKYARSTSKPQILCKQSQRAVKIRQNLLANMSTRSSDDQYMCASHQSMTGDTESINSYHSMEESLDPSTVQDYGPRREFIRQTRPKRINPRDETFLQDERLELQEYRQNEMVFFESVEDITKNMMEEDSLIGRAMNGEMVSSEKGSNFGPNRHEDMNNINGVHQRTLNEQIGEGENSKQCVWVTEMPSSRTLKHHHPIEDMISSISNSGELIQAPVSHSTLTEDSKGSWVDSLQGFDSIHGAKTEVTQVESDLTSSKKRIKGMFDTLHQVRQEALSMERRKPERDAESTKQPGDCYHPVTPGAPKEFNDNFFDEVRLSGSKAEFQVTHNDSEASGFDADDEQYTNQSIRQEQVPDHQRAIHEHDQKYSEPLEAFESRDWVDVTKSNDIPLPANPSGTHPQEDEAAYIAEAKFRNSAVKEEYESDPIQPVPQVRYRNTGVNIAISTVTYSSDESNFDAFNPYKSSHTGKIKGVSFSKVQERGKEISRAHMRKDFQSHQAEEDANGQILGDVSPRHPRSPLHEKAMQKARKHVSKERKEENNFQESNEALSSTSFKENEEVIEQKSSPKYPLSPAVMQMSSPGYPKSPAFGRALQKATKHFLEDPPQVDKKSSPEDANERILRNVSPRYPPSPLHEKAMQKARKHVSKEHNEASSSVPLKENEVVIGQTSSPRYPRSPAVTQISSPGYPKSPAFGRALHKARSHFSKDLRQDEIIPQSASDALSSAPPLGEDQQISAQTSLIDINTLPPPPSMSTEDEEDTNTVKQDNLQYKKFHESLTPRAGHGRPEFTTNGSRLHSVEIQKSSSSLSRFLRVDTSRSDEGDVGLNCMPNEGPQSLNQDALRNWDMVHGFQSSSLNTFQSRNGVNDDMEMRSAAQASGVPQQVLDIILKQAAEHEQELDDNVAEEDLTSWDAIAKSDKKPRKATTVFESLKSQALYSLPKKAKTKPINLNLSLIPDEIPDGVSKEDVRLLERFIQLSTSKFNEKHLSVDSEKRVRAAARNVGLAESIIDQMLEQARWMREQKEEENKPQQHHHIETTNLHVHFEDGNATFKGPNSPETLTQPESPGYTQPSPRRRSQEYRYNNRNNPCQDTCRILGNIKDNLLYWANCHGDGSFDEDDTMMSNGSQDRQLV